MVSPQDPAIRVKILWIWHLFSGWSLAFRWSWSHGWQFGQNRTYMQNHANLLLCMYTKLDKYTNPRVDRIWMNMEFPNILTKITKMDFSLKILFSIYFRMITIYIYIYVCVLVDVFLQLEAEDPSTPRGPLNCRRCLSDLGTSVAWNWTPGSANFQVDLKT